jgi:putative transposase
MGIFWGASVAAEAYTSYVRKILPAGSFTLLSYCLMPNHFHLEIRQNGNVPISKLISKVCTSYGKYFNKKYGNMGGLFQDAFKAVSINSDSQLLWLSAYTHNNPRVARLVTDLKNYSWSSYLDYTGLRQGTLRDKNFILSQFKNTDEYINFVKEAESKIKVMKDIQGCLLDSSPDGNLPGNPPKDSHLDE